MAKLNLPASFKDERGEIIDLITEQVDAVTLITFAKDAVRANHWHEETTQWNFVLQGQILYKGVTPDGKTEELLLSEGDFVKTEPRVAHALKGVSEAARILVFTQGPRSGNNYESDTFRLDRAILE